MTTIKDIQEGNYCPNCDANCRLFVHESDCCLHDTWIARIAIKVGTSSPEDKVQYEYKGKSVYVLTIENQDNSDKLNVIKNKI